MCFVEDASTDSQQIGLRTNKNKHGLRKAIYHAQTIVGRMPRTLVSVSAAHANGADEYFPHVYAMAGVEGDRLGVLLWSYVTSPGRQAVEVLRDMGYGPADFARWGGQTHIAAFLANAIAVSALTSVPSEQADLERMKAVFYRQRALVTETSHVSLAIDGFASTGGYRVKRWLIDATHNNTYGTYVASGLNAAIAAEGLQQLDTQLVADLSQIPDVDLAPYAVMLLEIERVAGTSGCTSPSTVGAARLNLSKLQAPSGDDQLKLGGTVAVPTSPPIDLVAHGLRLSPHHQRRRRPRRPHCPRGIEVVGEPRRHGVEVSRPVGVERHRQRERAGDQAGRHAAREAEGPRPRARRRAGGHAAGGDDRVRGADSGAGTVRRHGVRGVPDDGERGDGAVSVTIAARARWRRRSPADCSGRDLDAARLDRSHLDAPAQVLVQARRRMLRRHLDGLVQIARLDEEVAPELLLGLGVRAVGDGDLAVSRSQAHGVLGGGERADLQQVAAALQILVQGPHSRPIAAMSASVRVSNFFSS